MTSKLWQEDVDTMTLAIHDYFVRTPLAMTEEGYDHFREMFNTLLKPFSERDYRNYN